MKWISNAPARKKPEEGTIYRLDTTMVSIHHYAGLGEKWFLTYTPLNISMHDLGTDDFGVAKEKSYLFIKKIFEKHQETVLHAMQMLSISLREKDDFSRF